MCEWDHLLAPYHLAILGISFGKEKFRDTHIERKTEICKPQTPDIASKCHMLAERHQAQSTKGSSCAETLAGPSASATPVCLFACLFV